MATQCSVCRKAKRATDAFCRSCYFRLPDELRKALWTHTPGEFGKAVTAARAWFRANPKTGEQ